MENKMETCKWPLNNIESLEFTIYDSNQNWNKVAGLYIFSYQTINGTWFPLYVGETDDFSSRLPSHERLNEAIQHGATHIHALTVPLETDRVKWEKALIQHLQPPMNIEYR
jgi:excinuclease UvrABC nuclease subunit